MRIIENKSQFIRLDGSMVPAGLFAVILKNEKEHRLLMDVEGHCHWVTPEELRVGTFDHGDRNQIAVYFGTLKKNTLQTFNLKKKIHANTT